MAPEFKFRIQEASLKQFQYTHHALLKSFMDYFVCRKLSLVKRKGERKEEKLDQLFPAASSQNHFQAPGQKHSINPCSCTAQECQGTVV